VNADRDPTDLRPGATTNMGFAGQGESEELMAPAAAQDRGPALDDPFHELGLIVDPGITLQDRGLGTGQNEMTVRRRIGKTAFPSRERFIGNGKMPAPMGDGIVDPRIDGIIDDGDSHLPLFFLQATAFIFLRY